MGIFHRTDKPHGGSGHTSVVAPGTRITGDLDSDGGVYVYGTVEGKVEAQTFVVVDEGARIGGEVHAKEVYLGGTVEGDIWAVEVEIYGGGTCRGRIEAIKIDKETKKG